jgi:hypothetical protein
MVGHFAALSQRLDGTPVAGFTPSISKGTAMTRSIFDPAGAETERSGSSFSPPEAEQDSHMPSKVEDGVVEETETEDASKDDDTRLPGITPQTRERRK